MLLISTALLGWVPNFENNNNNNNNNNDNQTNKTGSRSIW